MSDGRKAASDGTTARSVRILCGDVELSGELTVPDHPLGVVVFAHGSGSSRVSPRNLAVAATLQRHGLATLLFDLLTDDEAGSRRAVFDIGMLAERLSMAMEQIEGSPALAGAPVGLFGASTGAAAALDAAAARPDLVRAVVSRGGRPDLARRLGAVLAPTLLVVGGADTTVLALNRRAAGSLGGPAELRIVEGAGHLFEGPGQLEEVASAAAGWFGRYLVDGAAATPGSSSS